VVRRPARNWVQLTLPGGQCRILMPRVPCPVLGALPSVASSSSSPSASRSAVVRRRPLLDAVDALAAHDAAALAPMPSSLQAPSLSAAPAARLPLAQPSTPHLCVANARACVRLEGGAWRTAEKRPRPLLPPPRQPPLLPGRKRSTGPCQAQNTKTRRRRVARARRAAPAVARPYRRLGPSEQPSRGPPIAPVVGLEPCCIAVL